MFEKFYLGIRTFGIAWKEAIAAYYDITGKSCCVYVETWYTPLPVWEQVAHDALPSQRDLCKRHSSHARDTRFLVVRAGFGGPTTGTALNVESPEEDSMSP